MTAGESEGGETEGGASEGGETEGGASEGGASEGGETEGGETEDGETMTVPIGAPAGDRVTITHELVVNGLRENLTQHIDEIDSALQMIENSNIIQNVIDLLSEDEEEDEGEEEGESEEESEEEDLEVDLSELRDSIIEIFTKDLLNEDEANLNEAGDLLTYTPSADRICTEDEDEEEDRSQEDEENRRREYTDCVRRINDHPITIEASAIGDRKINLSMRVGEMPATELQVQIHDDLIAGFIPLPFVKSAIRLLVDEEDLELPDTMEGLIAAEARRVEQEHFALRFAILEDVVIQSVDAESLTFSYGTSMTPGALSLNGPERVIEGSLDIETIEIAFPWQEMVNFLHDDEEERRTECFDNSETVEACRRYRDDCMSTCYNSDDITACRTSCAEGLDGEARAVSEAFTVCMDTVSEDICGAEDQGCRSAQCYTEEYNAVCDNRSWCEEVVEPAEEPAVVSGQLKVFLQAITGQLRFDAEQDLLYIDEASLGDETMSVKVEDDQIIGVDLNADTERRINLRLAGGDNGGLSFQVSPLLNLQVALNLEHVWDAFVDEADDLPTVLANDILGIRFDGSEMPTIDLVSQEDEMEMRVSSGVLTLSSPNMSEDVTIEEGMCMGSEDEDLLSEEERDSRHELFGMMLSVECTLD